MPYTTDFSNQLADWWKQQVDYYTGQVAGAQRNARVWEWGGSGADQNHWNTVANNNQGVVDQLNRNKKEVLDLAKQGDIGPENTHILQKAFFGDTISREKLNEMVAGNLQLQGQNKALADFRNKLETQQFGGVGLDLKQALTSTAGDIGSLNQFLGQQEAQAFNTQLKPLIQMALGSQGLSESGAQIELQSKALAQLEQQRQQAMMQAALGARNQIQGVQRSDILGNIGFQQQMMNNQFDLSRAGITMQFQRELENQREQLARELSSRQSSGGLGGILGMGGGMGLGAIFGGLTGVPGGAMMGAGLGGMLGGGIGNYMSPNVNYGGLGNIPSGFFAAGASMGSHQPKEENLGYGPGNSYLSPSLSMIGPWAGRRGY